MIRKQNLDKTTSEIYDMAIIGGGITGAGILIEAGKLGYHCILIEKNDFASGTTSKSAKLIHGGLRYLQYGRFGIVKESLKERQYLLEHFPHLVKPLPFIFPLYHSKLKYRIAMILYQLLSKGKHLPRYSFLDRNETIRQFAAINQKGLKGSFIYYDAITNDALLCNELIHNACNATFTFQCVALNYCELRSIKPAGLILTEGQETFVKAGDMHESHIQLNCYDHIEKKSITIKSRYIINASGPWTDEVLKRLISSSSDSQQESGILSEWFGSGVTNCRFTAPSKGVHIVLSQKRFPIKKAIVFSSYAQDKRRLYALPWEHNSVIIGPTDTEYEDDLDYIKITPEDISYILNAIQHFAPSLKINERDIVSSFVGIRPLFRDSNVSKDRSRDYKIWWSGNRILNILGGKLTAFRPMAKSLMQKFQKISSPSPPLATSSGGTDQLTVPGGKSKSKVLPSGKLMEAIKSKYGEHSDKIFDIFMEDNVNEEYLHDDFKIYIAEIIYLVRYLSCYHLDDLLNRRLSLGYVLPGCNNAEVVIKKTADIMKKECAWSDEEYQAEISNYTEISTQVK